MKRPNYPQGPTVTPQQFGAKGDGKTDDIHALRRAREYASLHNMPLELPEADYYTSSSWQLDNVTIISRNARISYHGLEFNRPAVEMFDYVNIFGDFNVWAIDYAPEMTHGNRCGIAFGDYDSGRGAHHCYLENPVLWGSGMPGGNGMLITGDSSDLLFDKMTVPEGHTHVNVPVMMHWGGYGEHHPADLAHPNTVYVHDEGYTRTKHPHDITIGLIDSHSAHSALYISACYDITVGEVRQYGGKSAVRVVAGDCGYKYATVEEKAHGTQNIRIGKVYGTGLGELGMYFNGIDSYEKDTLTEIAVQIGEAVLEGKGEGSGNGICFYGTKSVEIGKLSLKGFAKSTFQLGHQNRFIKIGEATVEDCHANVITSYSTLEKKPRSGETYLCEASKNIRIEKLSVKNSGNETVPFATFPYIDGFRIDELTVTDSRFANFLRVYQNTKNVAFDRVELKNTTVINSLAHAANAVTAENNIALTVGGADGVALTAGEACEISITSIS